MVRQNDWVYPAAGRGKDFAWDLDDMMISGPTVVKDAMQTPVIFKCKYSAMQCENKKSGGRGIAKSSSELGALQPIAEETEICGARKMELIVRP